MNHTVITQLNSAKYTVSLGLTNQVVMRETPLNKWLTHTMLSDRLSGTLKKNARLGFKHNSQLYHEAICQTMGWGFEAVSASRVTLGAPITEGDCHAITEVGWHVDRMIHTWAFEEDIFELKYICIHSDDNGIIKEGIGVVVSETSVQWIKSGDILFALIAEFNPITKEWTEAVNPF